MTRQGLGRQLLTKLIREIGDKAIVENMPRQEGNTLHAILAPPKTSAPAKPKPPQAQQQQPPQQQQGGGAPQGSAAQKQ
jgi:translation initiation factor IF-3